MRYRRLLPLLFPLVLSGCMVNQTMALKPDGTGTASIAITLQDFFVQYLQSLAESVDGTASGGERTIFDLDAVALSFSVQPELDLQSVSSPSVGKLNLAVRYGPLDKVIAGSAADASVFAVTRSGTQTTLKFHLDRKNFDSLARLLPLYETGKSLYLFPDPSNPMTEAEYLDYLAWAFEGVAGAMDVRSAIGSSVVKVRIDVKGVIVSQTGGTVSGNSVEYAIPVLRALTLEKPVDLSITFRP